MIKEAFMSSKYFSMATTAISVYGLGVYPDGKLVTILNIMYTIIVMNYGNHIVILFIVTIIMFRSLVVCAGEQLLYWLL